MLNKHPPNIAIVDLGLPYKSNLTLISCWRGHSGEITLLVLVLVLVSCKR